MGDQDEQKKAAALAALAEVRPGLKLGLGSGSTSEFFVRALGEKVRDGFPVVGVPTSERTARLATSLGIPLSTLDEMPRLDLAVDGADEIDSSLRLIKGGGGALLREKIVAYASARMIVIVDRSKLVDRLGAFPLPIEVNLFGLRATVAAIEAAAARLGLAGKLERRLKADGTPFATDGGHAVVDASFGLIPEPEALALALSAIPGVVEHGLFIGLASAAAVAGPEGVRWLQTPGP